MRIAESHQSPGLRTIGRLVHAVTPVRASRAGGVAAAEPHDFAIRRCDGDGSDGSDPVRFRHQVERGAAVYSLPKSAGSYADVEGPLMRFRRSFGNRDIRSPRTRAERAQVA